MKNELTPQIAAMYLGQKCTVKTGPYGQREKMLAPADIILMPGLLVTPHLRPLSSLTEAEARELYEIVNGEKWDTSIDHVFGAPTAIYDWWNNFEEFYEDGGGSMIMGFPFAFLKLLEWGMDLFGGIEAGWAKEIETKI